MGYGRWEYYDNGDNLRPNQCSLGARKENNTTPYYPTLHYTGQWAMGEEAIRRWEY